jgi:tetratricopeptide (TPR) repeat protein
MSGQKNQGSGEGFLERNKRMVVILGLLVLVAGLLPQVEQRRKKKKNDYVDLKEALGDRSVSSITPPDVLEKNIRASEVHFREGFREYRAGNYTRAIASFETCLQIYAAHPLAKIYLENSKKNTDTEAKQHFDVAKRDEEANRLSSAIHHYEAIKRLYSRDPAGSFYKEADDKIKDNTKKQKRQDMSKSLLPETPEPVAGGKQ